MFLFQTALVSDDKMDIRGFVIKYQIIRWFIVSCNRTDRVQGMGSIIHKMRYYSYEDIDIFLAQCPVCSIVNDVCDDLLPTKK